MAIAPPARVSSDPSLGSAVLTVDQDLASGEVVGEYVVDGKLGQGAFGTVYRGAHPVIGKQVAIKVLARKYSVDPEITSRFVAEARAVNQIRHKNIIDIFSFGTLSDGRQYYVMEYLDGEPLDRLIERSGRIPLGDALPILRGVARALDAAHAKSIAHRDLKAENVFLASDGDGVWPKLLDFGIAKLLADDTVSPDGRAPAPSHKTRTGYSIGTPYYMSPEQARGKNVDHRTDIYSLGILAYVMLVGKYPFDGEDYMEVLMHQLQDEPPPASQLVTDLPPGVDDAIAWLMRKDPAERPKSCRDGVAALEQAAEAAGIQIVPDLQTGPVSRITVPPRTPVPLPSSARLPGTPKRSRLPIVLGFALLVAALGVGAILMRSPRNDAVAETTPTPTPSPVHEVIVPQPSPAPADAQATVVVTVDGTPANTEVLVGGMLVGTAPGPVQLPRGPDSVMLTFKADGFVAMSKPLVPDRDQALSISMKRRPKKRSRDDLIDVFPK